MKLEKIYFRLPYWIKLIIINIQAWLINKERYTKRFYSILNNYKAIDYKNAIYDEENVLKVINQSSYYRRRNAQTLSDFPVINKQVVKNNWNLIFNKQFLHSYFYSSGTTGSGLKYPVTKEFIFNQWAVYWKFRNMHNIYMTTKCAYFIGRSILNIDQQRGPFWFNAILSNQLFLSQYHLNHNTVAEYLIEIKKNNIKWIHGYPSTLSYFAHLISENNLFNLAEETGIEIITVSSEKLFDYQKENIEHVFKCRVRQLYSQVEGVATIFECEEGLLHVDEHFSIVEFIPIRDNLYKIVGTQLNNKSFPLVRYETGDTVACSDVNRKCTCGRKSRIVDEIIGRDEDYLILSNGVKVGRLDHLFKDSYNIHEAQIYQNEIGKAIFRIVKSNKYSYKDEQKLANHIREKLGNSIEYKIEYKKSIPKTRSGKFKFVINEIS